MNRGYLTLTSVLIIGAIILVISLFSMGRTMHEARLHIMTHASYQALSLANTCADLALLRLQTQLHYAGEDVIMVGNGSCTIGTISGEGNVDRSIEVKGVYGDYERTMEIEVVTISPTTTISRWEEV